MNGSTPTVITYLFTRQDIPSTENPGIFTEENLSNSTRLRGGDREEGFAHTFERCMTEITTFDPIFILVFRFFVFFLGEGLDVSNVELISTGVCSLQSVYRTQNISSKSQTDWLIREGREGKDAQGTGASYFQPFRLSSPGRFRCVHIFPIKKQMVVPPSPPLITEAKRRTVVRFGSVRFGFGFGSGSLTWRESQPSFLPAS